MPPGPWSEHLCEIEPAAYTRRPVAARRPPHRPARSSRAPSTRSRRSARPSGTGSGPRSRPRRVRRRGAGRRSLPVATRSSTRRPGVARPWPRSCGAWTGSCWNPRRPRPVSGRARFGPSTSRRSRRSRTTSSGTCGRRSRGSRSRPNGWACRRRTSRSPTGPAIRPLPIGATSSATHRTSWSRRPNRCT